MVSFSANHGHKTQLMPIREAKNALKMLYDWKLAHSTEPPTLENFYPVDLDLMARLLDWTLVRVAFVGFSESFEPLDAKADFEKKNINIGVRDKMPKGRVNYSIAHEIGHVILHGEEGVKLLRRTRSLRERRASQPRFPHNYEVEADRFAAELLMPPRAVRQRFQQLFKCPEIIVDSVLALDIAGKHYSRSAFQEGLDRRTLARSVATYDPDQQKDSLCAFFDVSVDAMANRLTSLRLVLG